MDRETDVGANRRPAAHAFFLVVVAVALSTLFIYAAGCGGKSQTRSDRTEARAIEAELRTNELGAAGDEARSVLCEPTSSSANPKIAWKCTLRFRYTGVQRCVTGRLLSKKEAARQPGIFAKPIWCDTSQDRVVSPCTRAGHPASVCRDVARQAFQRCLRAFASSQPAHANLVSCRETVYGAELSQGRGG